jgi:hypothetical protein
MTLATQKLSQLLGVLTALKTQFVVFSSQFATQLLKLKVLLVSLTTVVLSIKVVVTNVLAQLCQLGSLLVTTAHQTLQAVKQVVKPNKTPAEQTKSEQ